MKLQESPTVKKIALDVALTELRDAIAWYSYGDEHFNLLDRASDLIKSVIDDLEKGVSQ